VGGFGRVRDHRGGLWRSSGGPLARCRLLWASLIAVSAQVFYRLVVGGLACVSGGGWLAVVCMSSKSNNNSNHNTGALSSTLTSMPWMLPARLVATRIGLLAGFVSLGGPWYGQWQLKCWGSRPRNTR
jgi:hypothetical protein